VIDVSCQCGDADCSATVRLSSIDARDMLRIVGWQVVAREHYDRSLGRTLLVDADAGYMLVSRGENLTDRRAG
jgi:hypothetical protein